MAEEATVKLAADTTKYTPPVEEAAKATDKLGFSLDELPEGDPLGPLGKSARQAADDVLGVIDNLDRLQRAHEEAVQEFKQAEAFSEGFDEASQEARELRENIVKTGRAFNNFATKSAKGLKGTEKELKRVATATKRARRELSRFAKAGGGLVGLEKKIGGVAIALKSLIGLGLVREFVQIISSIVATSAQFVKVKASIDAVGIALKETLGGASGAAQGLAFLDSVSDKLGVQIRNIAPQFVSLTAALKDTALGAEATRDVFEAITETGVAFGRTQDQITRALTAITQIAGKGVAQMEELRQQLGEQLPGSLQALAKGLAEIRPDFDGTVASLFELTAAGNLAAEEAIPALTIGLRELAGTAAAEQMEELSGLIRQLGAAAEDAQVSFADGLEPELKTFLTTALALSDVLERAANTAGVILGQALGSLAGDLGVASAAFEQLGTNLDRFATDFPNLSETLGITDIADAFKGTADAVEKELAGIEQAAINAASGIAGPFEEASSKIGAGFAGLTEIFQEQASAQLEAAEISNTAQVELRQETNRKLSEAADRSLDGFKERLKAEVEARRESELEQLNVRRESQLAAQRLQEEQRTRQEEILREQEQAIARLTLLEAAEAEKKTKIRQELLAGEEARTSVG